MIGLFLFYWLMRFRNSRTRIVSDVLSASLLACVALSVGCRETEIVQAESEKPLIAATTPVKRAEQTHSVTAETVMSSSPAANSLSTDPATESPESVCRAFMDRLENGDRIGAENLLTRAALTTTHRANLKLEPITSPASQTTIRSARYTSQHKRTAEVDCVITETTEGETIPISLSWQVVRQPNGWRVCGMLVPLGASEESQLLSFESIDDVATIKLLAAAEAISESQQREFDRQFRQADANKSSTSLQ